MPITAAQAVAGAAAGSILGAYEDSQSRSDATDAAMAQRKEITPEQVLKFVKDKIFT